ncbi:MAG TPA: hypothetical protein VIK18_11660 [Pirellulales bacterium]
MQYQVTIQDDDGTACRMSLSIPFTSHGANPSNSHWQVLDQGMIKFQGGGCSAQGGLGTNPVDMALASGAGASGSAGIWINALFDGAGFANASGVGTLIQSWALALRPGTFSWWLSTGDAPAATSKTASNDDYSDDDSETFSSGDDGGGDYDS